MNNTWPGQMSALPHEMRCKYKVRSTTAMLPESLSQEKSIEGRHEGILECIPFGLTGCRGPVLREKHQEWLELIAGLVTCDGGDDFALFRHEDERRVCAYAECPRKRVRAVAPAHALAIAIVCVRCSLEIDRVGTFSIEFDSVVILVDVGDHVRVGERVGHHHFARPTPLRVNVHDDFAGFIGLRGHGLFDGHPLNASVLGVG